MVTLWRFTATWQGVAHWQPKLPSESANRRPAKMLRETTKVQKNIV
jgi:hypothetical protein